MLQEVQTQTDRYKNPNDIEGIGYTERRLSYKTQIRDKEGAGASYCKILLFFSSNAPAGQFTSFDNNTIETPSNDVSIPADAPQRTFLTPGIYILTLYMHPHNSNINYTCSATLWSGGNGDTVLEFHGTGGKENSSSAVFSAAQGDYLVMGVFTDYAFTNTNGTFAVISKIG